MVLLVAAACSSAQSAREQGQQSTPASPTASPTIQAGKPCPPAPPVFGLDGASGCATSATGDYDGDGISEEFQIYARLNSQRFPTSWHARIVSNESVGAEATLTIGSKFNYPTVVGTEDADQDGLDEAFVKTQTHLYHSGATRDIGMFGLRDNTIFQITENGKPFNVEVGGVSYYGHGAECRDIDFDGTPEFLSLRIDDVIGDVQRWSEQIYSWKHRSLFLTKTRTGRLAKTSYSDPLLRRFYEFSCFTLDPPFPY